MDGLLGELVTDKELAYAWLYGDLVHADEISDKIAAHDIDDRFRGGVLLACNIAVIVIATLNLLRMIRARGLLVMDDDLFDRRVNARNSSILRVDRFVMGPAGTSVADLEAALDSTPVPVADLAAGEAFD